MKIKVGIVMLLSVLFLLVNCLPALAHNLWLNPGEYFPQVGSTVDIGIGWGHKYPANRVDQEVKEDRVEAIQAVDPDGLTVNLTRVSAALYRLPIEKVGAYLVTARIKPGFFTMTPEGRKWGDKTSVADPIKCTNFHLGAKTVILAGGEGKNLRHAAGQPLEVIPLTNLEALKAGDKLPVKVIFEGEPLAGIAVKATYAGFEDKGETQHGAADKGAHGAGHFPVKTVTDDQGLAEIPLDTAGYWMILLSHKPPYPDRQTCDEYMYNMAFTCQVR